VLYRWTADLTVLLHFLFILFVIFGAVLATRLPRLKRIHWAALSYGLLVEVCNWYCPLTLIEQWLRRAAGQQTYERSFLVHYLEWLIYWDVPQWVLIAGAIGVVAANVAIYYRDGRQVAGSP
jgi:succinate-acetate transporter protein